MREIIISDHEELLGLVADAVIKYASENDLKAKSVAYNLDEHIVEMEEVTKERYNALVVHEILDNVEKALDTSVNAIKAGDVYMVGDESQIDSNICEDVYDEINGREKTGDQ